MKKGILLLILVWAIVSTAIAVNKCLEMEKIEKELAKYKQYKYYNDSKVKELQDRVEALENLNEFYKKQYLDLISKYNSLKREMDRKNLTIAQLKKKIERYTKVPYDYYDDYFPKHNNTLKDLESFVSELEIPANLSYSEKVAYLEWALRNAGFKAHIVYGEVEDEGSGNESIRTWVVCLLDNGTYFVDIKSNKPIVFNATEELKIEVNGVEKEYEYEPINIFRDIYSVIAFFGNVEDWDWWNTVGFPPKTT